MITETDNEMEEFFILDAQNEGIKIHLPKADGSMSEHYFIIYGHFSDTFQRVRREIMAAAPAEFKKLKGDEDAKEAAIKERSLRLTASLIKSWSFSQPCSTRQKVLFLEKAPQIVEYVDRCAGEQSLFTKESSNSSLSGSDGTSDSPPQSLEASTPPESI